MNTLLPVQSTGCDVNTLYVYVHAHCKLSLSVGDWEGGWLHAVTHVAAIGYELLLGCLCFSF